MRELRGGSGGFITGSGCCSRGTFRVSMHDQRDFSRCPFDFVIEVHLLCAPRIPYCSFPVSLLRESRTYSVSVAMNCNCVVASGEESEPKVTYSIPINDTYSVPIESLGVLEYDPKFN